MIRLHPAPGAVVDEAIYPVNCSGGNRREIQCSAMRRREDRTRLAASEELGAGVGGIEHCGDSAPAGAEAADSASSRPRICAATQRVYVAAPDGVAGVSVGFVWSATPSASQNSPDPGKLRPFGQQVGRTRCGASDACSKRYVDVMSVGGKCPRASSMSEKHRSVRDLPLIQSTVKYGDLHIVRRRPVTDIVGSTGLDMSSHL